MSVSTPPKALLFDVSPVPSVSAFISPANWNCLVQVFGTVVDQYNSIGKALATAASDKLDAPSASIPPALRETASQISWDAFALKWDEAYSDFVDTYDPSTPFITVSQAQHKSLRQLVEAEGLSGLWTDEELLTLSLKWHYLDPWPDAVRGLAALKQKFPICTLSNGDTKLLTDMASYAKLPWTRIFSAEDFHAYKPSPLVYEGAANALGLPAEECALVAAHLGDLRAARKCGYQTIFVEREKEGNFSKEEVEEVRKEGWVDMWVALGDGGDEGGLLEVAKRFEIELS